MDTPTGPHGEARKPSFAERNPITPMRHSRYRRPPQLPPPSKTRRVDWVTVKHDLIRFKAGTWLLIGDNLASRLAGQNTYAIKRLGRDFVNHFGVEIYAHKLPPRHDDLPSGYNIYARKNPQKKEIGK